MAQLADDITDTVLQHNQPGLWDTMSALMREQIRRRVRARSLDLVREKNLLNHIFLETGRAEFRFIGRSGAYFGFAFGLA